MFVQKRKENRIDKLGKVVKAFVLSLCPHDQIGHPSPLGNSSFYKIVVQD